MVVAYAEIGGRETAIEYDVTEGGGGGGPAVVLVHGTAATREQWHPYTAELVAAGFTVIAPDLCLPGAGSGSAPLAGAGLADLSAEVVAVADHAGLDGFHMVGHSLGAMVAAWAAATSPERVRSLVMHAGWAYTDQRMAEEFRYWLDLLRTDAAHGTALFARMVPLMAFGPGYWAAGDSASHAGLVAELAANLDVTAASWQSETDLGADLRPMLPRITAPALLLASAHDRLIGEDQQQALAAGMTDTRRARVDAGHGAPAENPAGFIAPIVSFLRGVAAAPGAVTALPAWPTGR